MSALLSKDDISISILASIIELIKRLKYFIYILLGYINIDLPKKLRIYYNPLDLKYYFLNYIYKAANILWLTIRE